MTDRTTAGAGRPQPKPQRNDACLMPDRWRPRVNAHVMFNGWELAGEWAWGDLEPADAPRDDGSEWWRLTVQVPADAYEVLAVPSFPVYELLQERQVYDPLPAPLHSWPLGESFV